MKNFLSISGVYKCLTKILTLYVGHLFCQKDSKNLIFQSYVGWMVFIVDIFINWVFCLSHRLIQWFLHFFFIVYGQVTHTGHECLKYTHTITNAFDIYEEWHVILELIFFNENWLC